MVHIILEKKLRVAQGIIENCVTLQIVLEKIV